LMPTLIWYTLLLSLWSRWWWVNCILDISIKL
jgi:hypothetical protein